MLLLKSLKNIRDKYFCYVCLKLKLANYFFLSIFPIQTIWLYELNTTSIFCKSIGCAMMVSPNYLLKFRCLQEVIYHLRRWFFIA